MRIVAPFRPFPPESDLHREIADFDWFGALDMLTDTAARSNRCRVHVLTDVDTTLQVPTLQYATHHRRLMLWTLEACLRYLDSNDFDEDTVMLDCDQLIVGDLRPFFAPNADLGILFRPTTKHLDGGRPVLNGVQFWSHRGKKRLAAFYGQALAAAESMSDELIRWGADTEVLHRLLAPLEVGVHLRQGVRVHLRDARDVIETFSSLHQADIDAGLPPRHSRPVLDFRHLRKISMRAAYESLVQRRQGVA